MKRNERAAFYAGRCMGCEHGDRGRAAGQMRRYCGQARACISFCARAVQVVISSYFR